MVKSKIFYDSIIRTADEWETSINKLRKIYSDLAFPDLMDLPYLEAVQSHYFAILNNNPGQIKEQIRMQAKRKLGRWMPIVWEEVLDSGKNCEFYRLDVPREIIIYRKEILDKPSAWRFDKTLHSKGPRAIRNLIEKLEKD